MSPLHSPHFQKNKTWDLKSNTPLGVCLTDFLHCRWSCFYMGKELEGQKQFQAPAKISKPCLEPVTTFLYLPSFTNTIKLWCKCKSVSNGSKSIHQLYPPWLGPALSMIQSSWLLMYLLQIQKSLMQIRRQYQPKYLWPALFWASSVNCLNLLNVYIHRTAYLKVTQRVWRYILPTQESITVLNIHL